MGDRVVQHQLLMIQSLGLKIQGMKHVHGNMLEALLLERFGVSQVYVILQFLLSYSPKSKLKNDLDVDLWVQIMPLCWSPISFKHHLTHPIEHQLMINLI